MNTQETMSEPAKLRIVQSYFGYAVAGAILTAAAAAVCFYINFILAGLMFSAFFVGIIDVMFRKVITVADSTAKILIVTDISLWRRPKNARYSRDDVNSVSLGIHNYFLSPKPIYRVSLVLKNSRTLRLKILWSRRKAEALRDKLAAVLGLDVCGPSS